jgi:hypothetical protein
MTAMPRVPSIPPQDRLYGQVVPGCVAGAFDTHVNRKRQPSQVLEVEGPKWNKSAGQGITGVSTDEVSQSEVSQTGGEGGAVQHDCGPRTQFLECIREQHREGKGKYPGFVGE